MPRSLRSLLLAGCVLGLTLGMTVMAPDKVWGPRSHVASFSDADAGARLDYQSRFVPPQNTAYDQQRAKSCCLDSCQGDMACEDGCNMWLHSSSLNYESDKWWDGLRSKCARDCERRDVYSKHKMLLMTAEERKKARNAWWMTHHITNDPDQCKVGCHHFRLCMNVFKAQEEKPPQCSEVDGTVWALCHGTRKVKEWHIGQEGKNQAIKNCNYAAQTERKWGTCGTATMEHWHGLFD